jgi:hypothetical protein
MKRRARPNLSLVVTCLLAVVLPALGCILSWLWTSTTTTTHECATGGSTSDDGLVVFAALVLLTPAGIALQAWRTRVRADYAVLAALVGAGIAVVAIFVTISFWWSGHNCMT